MLRRNGTDRFVWILGAGRGLPAVAGVEEKISGAVESDDERESFSQAIGSARSVYARAADNRRERHRGIVAGSGNDRERGDSGCRRLHATAEKDQGIGRAL